MSTYVRQILAPHSSGNQCFTLYNEKKNFQDIFSLSKSEVEMLTSPKLTSIYISPGIKVEKEVILLQILFNVS